MGGPIGAILLRMDIKRDQLETRIATLELMVITERARPKPNQAEIDKLEKQVREAKAALENYNRGSA